MLARKDARTYDILIIEDNPGDFILIEDYLLEYIELPRLVHVTSLHEAKHLIGSDCSVKFDIVMLDLTLPDGDGTSLIREIVDICSDWPIVVLTGYADFEFSIKSLALGVSDYLLKDDLTASSLYKSIIYNIERKRAQSDLEESQKRYSNLFHLSPDPTWVCESGSGKFLDVNDAAVHSYGYSQEEFLTMAADDLAILDGEENHKNDYPEFYDMPLRARLETVLRHKKKNGQQIFVEMQTSEILFQGVQCTIAVARDVTERINYIGAIEKQNQRFSEIAWIQSHVVRAPIARLMGLVDLMKHPASDAELKKELLDYIFDSATELDGIVREITLKAEEIDLNISQS